MPNVIHTTLATYFVCVQFNKMCGRMGQFCCWVTQRDISSNTKQKRYSLLTIATSSLCSSHHVVRSTNKVCASNLTHRLSTHLPLYYGLNESHSSRASSLKQHSDTKPHSGRRMCKKHTRKNVNMQILKSQQKSVLL